MDEATLRLYTEGNQARISGDYDAALPLLQQALECCPDSAQCWWALAHVLLNVGEFEVAIEHFEQSIRLEPGNARHIVDLAKSLEMLGEFDRARPLLEQAIEIAPGTREAEEARKSLSYYR